MRKYVVNADWDAEACVWVAGSDDVPGLAVEAETCEEVLDVVADVLPDLFEGNGLERGSVSLVFNPRVETLRLAAA